MKTLNENFSRILTLLEQLEQIQGRTKFQKIIYILKSKGVPFNEKFKFHYFGPFSSDLQLEIEELVYRNIIIEKGINPYVYEFNKKHKDSFKEDNIIKNNKTLLNFLNEQDYKKLELVSTMFFLQNNLSDDERIIKKKTLALKPHLSKFIEEAFILKKQIESF